MISSDAYTPPTSDTILTEGDPFLGYVYSYPHKTAYRRSTRRFPWPRRGGTSRAVRCFYTFTSLFCEMRCGFCNLFTISRPEASLPGRYLEQLAIQAEGIDAAIPGIRFARLAIGGGTPTALSIEQLQRLFAIITDVLGAQPREIPVSLEGSPTTVTAEKLAVLRELGVDRLSLGVQSFDDGESRGIGRPQHVADVEQALAMARAAGFPTINIDLIYGGPQQSVAHWLGSVRRAIEHRPQELYLYPLYVRPLTGMGVRGGSWPDVRMECYREARALLIDSGYRQVSLRMFQAVEASACAGPVYCCQADGMIGLGCGARSYTSELHYATPYAVRRSAVRTLVEQYLARPRESFAAIDHGIRLDADDQRRRWLLLSLLQAEGFSRADYAARCGGDVFGDLPQLTRLEVLGLMEVADDRLRLTETGLDRSAAFGPLLFSRLVRGLLVSLSWTVACSFFIAARCRVAITLAAIALSANTPPRRMSWLPIAARLIASARGSQVKSDRCKSCSRLGARRSCIPGIATQ